MRLGTQWCFTHDIVCKNVNTLDSEHECHDGESTCAFEDYFDIEISLYFSVKLVKTAWVDTTAKFGSHSCTLFKYHEEQI